MGASLLISSKKKSKRGSRDSRQASTRSIYLEFFQVIQTLVDLLLNLYNGRAALVCLSSACFLAQGTW